MFILLVVAASLFNMSPMLSFTTFISTIATSPVIFNYFSLQPIIVLTLFTFFLKIIITLTKIF